MQSEAALQRVGQDAGKGRQQGTAQDYTARCSGEKARTRGGRKQAVPQPAKTGTERKRGNRPLLRDGACYCRTQRTSPGVACFTARAPSPPAKKPVAISAVALRESR
jgi:hypothetical protein